MEALVGCRVGPSLSVLLSFEGGFWRNLVQNDADFFGVFHCHFRSGCGFQASKFNIRKFYPRSLSGYFGSNLNLLGSGKSLRHVRRGCWGDVGGACMTRFELWLTL